jgi:hypothetical protein
MLRMITPRQLESDLVQLLPFRFLGRADESQDLLERNAVLQSPSRIEELVKIFIHATKVNGTPVLAGAERRFSQ